MKTGGLFALLIAILALVATADGIYVVNEWDQVILTEFGDPVGDPVTEAGLHFKTPFVQTANRFDKRVLSWDGERNRIPTADKRNIWLDTTARWRIEDPLKFLQAVRTEEGAQTRLDDILDASTRNQVGAHNLVELVRLTNRVREAPRDLDDEGVLSSEYMEEISTGRDRIAELILEGAQERAGDYGIELLDVRIKRINYVESVRQSVYQRMKAERNRVAERYRSEGQGTKARILGKQQKEEKRIDSSAYKDAQELVAKADAEAARIYAESFNQDPEFYAFIKTLETYRAVVGDNHTLVVSPESPLYRYLAGPGTGVKTE